MSSLCGHKKKCKVEKEDVLESNIMFEILKQNIELMKQNNEFKELMIEQKNTIIPANNDELVAELLKQNNEFKELMLGKVFVTGIFK